MKKTIILLIFLFVISYIGLSSFFTNNKTKKIDSILNSHVEHLETHYKVLLYHQNIGADVAYLATLNKKGFIDIFEQLNNDISKIKKDTLRKELYNLLKQKYKFLKQKGILQYQFVLPNNESFLRMHKPSKYGDDLGDIRVDYYRVNKTKKEVSGFVQGRISHGFRHTYPILNKAGVHLGAMEVSFSSDIVQEYLTNVSNIETHFLVDKNIFDKKVWDKKAIILKYLPSVENPDYLVTINRKSLDKSHKKVDLSDVSKEIVLKMKKMKKFALYIMDNQNTVVVSFYPIKNFDGKVSAWIVSYEKDNMIQGTIKNIATIKIIIFILLLLLFYFIFYILQQKKRLDTEVEEKTRELQLLNESLEQTIKDEVEKNHQKDVVINSQSRLASMGEMIGNIAHQWRQPLNALGITIQKMQRFHQMDKLDEAVMKKSVDKSMMLINKMSDTIDDFMGFFRPDKTKIKFSVSEVVEETVNLLEASLKNSFIEVNIEKTQDDTSIDGYRGEFTQVILNIISNAKDILLENKIKKPKINITISKENDEITINIKDNGGGIPSNIIDKVFEPYFTTKDQGKGTGIGLYMSKMIIEENIGGKISVKNADAGACFTIKLNKEILCKC